MQLGRTSVYGILATLQIAIREKEGAVSAEQIAKGSGMPAGYVLEILQQLVRSRVLRSSTGKGGGYSLTSGAIRTTSNWTI